MSRKLWLGFGKHADDLTLKKTDRLSEVLENVTGKPSFILVVGATARKIASQVFGQSPRSAKGITLRLVPKRLHSDYPLLLAEGPSIAQPAISDTNDTGDLMERTSQMMPAIYSRLLSPFADIVCLSLSDFTNLGELVQFLSTWISNTSPSPSLILPRLLIFVNQSDYKTDESIARDLIHTIDSSRSAAGVLFLAAFCSLTVHSVPSPNKMQNGTLRSVLVTGSLTIRSRRATRQMLFHRDHVVGIFDEAYDCLLRNRDFDYVVAGRSANPVPYSAARHITLFLANFLEPFQLLSFALPVVASAFMLDAFSGEIHSTLLLTFQTLI